MPAENIRITCSTEDLDAKLSKSMKELGAHHDQYGRLLNAQNQYVAGLSQARIKMGDWIDAQGRARDAAGGFLDGLTATELKLRFYKDELGNVYNAEGELVRVSEELAKAQKDELAKAEQEAARAAQEAAKAQQELATAGQRGVQSMLSGAKGAAKMANNLSLMLAVLGNNNEGLNKFARGVMIGTQTFSQFALAMKTLPKFINGFKLLAIATKGQAAAQVILNAVSGNWVALIAGGLAAGTLAYKALSSTTKEVAQKTADAAKQVDALTIAYKKLEGAQTGVTRATAAGLVAAGVSEIEMLEERRKKIKDLESAYKNASKAFLDNEAVLRDYDSKNGIATSALENWGFIRRSGEYKEATEKATELAEKMRDAQEPLEEASEEYARAIKDLVAKDLPTNELQELQRRATEYANYLQEGNGDKEALKTAQTALAENQRKQADYAVKELEGSRSLEEAKRRAAEMLGQGTAAYNLAINQLAQSFQERAAEEQKKAAETAKGNLGDFGKYASGYALYDAEQKAAADFNETVRTWTENYAAAGYSQTELKEAIQNLKKEYEKDQLARFKEANGLQVKQEEEKDALEKYNNTLDKIREAQEQYGLEAAEAEKLRAQASKEYADALEKQKQDAERERESRLNELGITQMREQAKTPYEKYLEQQQKIAKATQEGLIDATEASKLNAKLTADYLEQNKPETIAEEQEQPEKTEGYKAADTLVSGSNELYKAMTQREGATERYQQGVTRNLDNMARYTEENNTALAAIQEQLAGALSALGVV